MAINVSVQYNGGLSPDIILLTQRECSKDWGGRAYDDSVPGDGTKTTPSRDRTT